jgi:RNA polymerase sigma-70 factor (ECF subfamily)
MSEELVAALKQRAPTAFEQLVARHGSLLYRVAWRLMGQREEAEEVVQETLLQVYAKIHSFDGGAALTTWLYRIVVNMALMRRRAKRRVPTALLDAAGSHVTEAGTPDRQVTEWALPPEEALLRREARTALWQGIEALPARYRAVYVLAEVEGLSYQEIGTMLELLPATVKTRLHRARLMLRAGLGDYFAERRRRSHGRSTRQPALACND